MGWLQEVQKTVFGRPPAAPAAPNYTEAAVAQGAANLESARASAKLSNPNVYSPYGNQTVTYNGDIPTVTQTLTPNAQRTLEQQQALGYNLTDLAGRGFSAVDRTMGTPFSFGGPSVQTSLGNFNSLQSATTAGQYGMAGGVNPSGYGQAQGGVNAPNLQSNLDLSGVARMPVNAGTTGQEAIMSRLEPSLAKNRVSTETQLVNQGLRPGSEAYDNAIQLLSQQENDARTQAALQGINLDIGANAQGYGQALSSGQFGNQTQLAGFDARMQNQQAANQAIAQNFGQGVTGQQLGNESVAQNYGRGLTSAQAENAKVAQEFNQTQQAAQFANTAQNQKLAQAIQERQMPLNEVNALVEGSQIQNPQFGPYQGSNVQAAPIANAATLQGQFDQNTYNAKVGTYNQNVAALYGLGGAVAYGAARKYF